MHFLINFNIKLLDKPNIIQIHLKIHIFNDIIHHDLYLFYNLHTSISIDILFKVSLKILCKTHKKWLDKLSNHFKEKNMKIILLPKIIPNWFKSYLCTLPEASPPANFVTSSKLTILKSPSTACFKQEAATANSMLFLES